jgi:MFS family permease
VPESIASASLRGTLAGPAFARLWLAWLAGNVAMWMHEVTAAWRMAQLTDDPVMVALVQAAGTLPLFLLGLPSGALADRFDRRRVYAVAQAALAAVAVVLAVVASSDRTTPTLLLALCLANGIGLAVRFPAFSALVPDLVPAHQLSAALTLNALAMNLTRVVGPLIAGAMIAALACALVLRARVPPTCPVPARGPHAPLGAAIAEGVRYTLRTPVLRAIVLRAFVFFTQTIGLIALLPLLARQRGDDATTYTAMLAAAGAGAVLVALALPQLPALRPRGRVVDASVLAYALATVGAVWAPHLWLVLAALALSGAAWLSGVNTLTMSAQLLLPPALRARGMAIYQMSIMGASAGGAALWGLVASHTSVATALVASAALGLLLLPLTRGLPIDAEAPLP